ncbi:MAG: pitrilysin family protein [Sorangiineae bacterium]|nr:pitrilysin family protein [Polyangiaceae bacterium]MEB2321619.1 pitrilysin family protein [Sorangiineae bacterium]
MRRFTLSTLSASVILFGCGGPTPPAAPAPAPSASSIPAARATEGAAVNRGALPGPGPAPAWAPPAAQRFELSNGVPVYFLEQGATPVASLMLIIPRGSATDPSGKSGLTELTADLLDEGAGKLGALELSEALELIATNYAANVDIDSTALTMSLLADELEPSVKLLADIVRRPKLSAAEFARRKAQHVASALAGEKEPATARAVVLRRALFGAGYGGNVARGTRSTLERLTLEDVKGHYRRLVQPDGAAFVVVGNLGVEPVRRALEGAFGDWKGKSDAPDAKPATTTVEHAVALIDFPGATQSALGIVTRADGEHATDRFPASVMNWAVGGAFTSRINLNLREDKGYTYGASSTFLRWQEAGLFGVFANVKSEVTRASVEEVFRELTALCKDEPLTDRERDEAVSGLLLGFPGRFEHGDAIAGELANLPLYARPLDYLQRWPERVRAVTTAEMNAVAKKYCDPSGYVVVIAGDRKSVEPSLAPLGLPVVVYDAEGVRQKP